MWKIECAHSRNLKMLIWPESVALKQLLKIRQIFAWNLQAIFVYWSDHMIKSNVLFVSMQLVQVKWAFSGFGNAHIRFSHKITSETVVFPIDFHQKLKKPLIFASIHEKNFDEICFLNKKNQCRRCWFLFKKHDFIYICYREIWICGTIWFSRKNLNLSDFPGTSLPSQKNRNSAIFTKIRWRKHFYATGVYAIDFSPYLYP